MLLTPFGELSSIDLNDQATQQKILFHDKHQLLEGLVAENHIDQILTSAQRGGRLVRLKVTSVFAKTGKAAKPYVLVLDHGCETKLLNAYLAQLAKTFNVKLVRYDENLRKFFTHSAPYTENITLDSSYGTLVKKMVSETEFALIAERIKNVSRQMQGFWGQMVSPYGSKLGLEVVLPRIFKNFAVQPYFNEGVWDIDQVYWDTQDHVFSVLEVKHKFPSDTGTFPLSFGINLGSVKMLLALHTAGFRCFHCIMVKPYWDKRVSITFLSNNLEARKNVLFCGKNFSREELEQLSKKKPWFAPSDTSLTGQKRVPVVFFGASSLFRIGLLDDSDLPERFALAITDQLKIQLTDGELRRRKLDHSLLINPAK